MILEEKKWERLSLAIDTFKKEHKQGIILINQDWFEPLVRLNVMVNKMERKLVDEGNGRTGLIMLLWNEIDEVPVIFTKFIDDFQVVNKVNMEVLV